MRRALIGLFVLASINCGELTTQGTSASYLIIRQLEAAKGSTPFDFGGDLSSDVLTVTRDGDPTIFADIGRVTFFLGLKDAGSPGLPTVSTPKNAITVTRYRVKYVRADGRNEEGVDVPYAFDGAASGTVQAPLELTFTIVRAQAKVEAPLAALATSLDAISTIAEITFYGHDQTGREVSVVGKMGVHFANWGD